MPPTHMRFFLPIFALMSAATLQARDIIVTDLTENPPVEARVAGSTADKVLRDFKALEWDGTPGARCHHPAYRIKEHANGKVTLDATICSACWNVRFFTPEKPLSGFQKDSASAGTLRETLGALFPKK